MKKYLLDTDILSYIGDDKSLYNDRIIQHLFSLDPDDILHVSDISIYEYQAGLYFLDEKDRKRIANGFNNIMKFISTLPLHSEKGGIIFGNIKKQYQRKTGINDTAIKKHTIDMIIASEAIVNNMTLVCNDKIFKTIAESQSDLQIEYWVN